MKKLLLSILILVCWFASQAQSPLRINKYLVDSLTGSGYWYLYHDSTHTGQWGLVAGSGGGGGGGGSVTAITQAYGIINTPNPITNTGTVKFDSATVFGNLTWDRVLKNGGSFGQNHAVNFGTKSLQFNSGSNYYYFGGSGSPGFDFYTDDGSRIGELSVAPGFSLLTTGLSTNYFQMTTNVAGTVNTQHFKNGNSDLFLFQDSIEIDQTSGKFNIPTLRNGSTFNVNKLVGWRDNNGVVGYITPGFGETLSSGVLSVDSTSGGLTSWVRTKKIVDSLASAGWGSGGAPGGSTKQVQYNNSSSFGGYAGFEVGNTNNDVLITAGASTSVPLNIKGASSQSANYFNISTSSSTGDILNVNSSGEMIFAGNSDAGAFDMQLDKGLYVANVGAAENGLAIDDNEDASNMFVVQANTNIWDVSAGGRALRLSSGFGSGQPVILAPGVTVTAMSIAQTGALMSLRFSTIQGADVASLAGAIALGTDGNVFEITGTNAITLISNVNWQNGAVVTLAFTSTATLTDGTANSGTDIGMELAGNTNFVASAGATLTLRLMEIGGTQRWREIARSVN